MARAVMTIVNGPEHSLAQLLEANRAGLEAAAVHWWRTMMPAHFTVEGGKKYSYQPRKGDDEAPTKTGKNGRTVSNNAYSWKKRRRKRHNKPLVWSGDSERMAKQSYRVTFKNEKKTGLVRCRLAMNVPAYFYKYKPGQPDKYAELTKTIPIEQDELLKVHNGVAERTLAAAPRVVKTTVVA